MIVQAWFTENTNPLTQEQRTAYAEIIGVNNQMIPIGNIVGSRRLIRCLVNDFQAIYDLLISAAKQPRICGVRNFAGDWIVESTDDGGNLINVCWKHDQAEYDKHMQPVASFDIEGNPIMIAAVGNTCAGWYDFNDVVPVLEII